MMGRMKNGARSPVFSGSLAEQAGDCDVKGLPNKINKLQGAR